MSLSFKEITVADKQIITSYIFSSPLQNCDLSFANICSWRFLYHSEYAESNGFLLIRFRVTDEEGYVYMFPIGNGDIGHAISLLEEDSTQHGHRLRILGITPPSKALLTEVRGDDFIYYADPNYFDYIYLRESLAGLAGKKLQPKRNHVNRFRRQYNYEYLPITPDLVPECLRLELQWFLANRGHDYDRALQYERRSMTFALNHAEELGLVGGAICVEGQIVAFSFGAPINSDTFCVHVEKADVRFDGAYSVINNEFALRIPQKFVYVNREEDLGLPGLRQAKQSYNPVLVLEKYRGERRS
jgi:hypothetical protein